MKRSVLLVACALMAAGASAAGIPRAPPVKSKRSVSRVAAVIPGDSALEYVLVDGTGNFLAIYNFLITARVLLSWFPQAQSIGALQPVFQLTDPYLNLFRGLIPPIGGLDLSVLPAFFLLNFAQSAAPALGAEVPKHLAGRAGKAAARRAAIGARAPQ